MHPDFLIVGAMKAGTTTLYRDLQTHPAVFLPHQKEPETLVRFGGDRARILADYRDLFSPAGPGQLRGEASTAYTKRPDHEGVADIARGVCGSSLKIIYLRRDPVERIVSHYRHEVAAGRVTRSLEEAVRADPSYVQLSRYDYQIAPWLSTFGETNVLQLEFERYVVDRASILNRVFTFLQLDPEAAVSIGSDQRFNASEGKRVPRSRLALGIVRSRAYQRVIKPLLPRSITNLGKSALLTAVATDKPTVSRELKDWLEIQLSR